MCSSLFSRNKHEQNTDRFFFWSRRHLLHICALFFFVTLIWLTFHPGPVHATAFDHTQATVDTSCQRQTFSTDGNPFPLCPGPFPTGGNCVWWGWEEWHLLGYNLPVNLGDAANWIVDAERFGLPIGTEPRVGSLAVFPVADGVWAFSASGHVAFVTSVRPDGQTFNVTYQNYGDATPMFTGSGYNVSVINEPRYQNGHLRFIYFPKSIDPTLFAKLPGVNGDNLPAITTANTLLNTGGPDGTLAGSRVALGLPPGSYDQEFDADFTGNGYTDLLLYDRQQGRLNVLALTYPYRDLNPRILHNYPLNSSQLQEPYEVSLHDSHTSATGWGPNLDIYLGDFTGSGHTEILLYNRISGQIQILALTPKLTIAKHITLTGWGPGWEVYTGQFDGVATDLLLYKRFAIPTPPINATTTPTPSPTPTTTSTATPSPSPTTTPTATPTTTPTATPSPSPTATPSPTPTTTPTATPTTTPTATPTATATSTAGTGQPTGSTGAPAVQLDGYNYDLASTPKGISEPKDTSGKSPSDWNTSGLTAEIHLIGLTKNFTVGVDQDYALWHNSWEIYIGRFVSPDRDGLFLYDRNSGEGRLVEFSSQLKLAQFQFLHNLGGNWEVHTGDFSGQQQAQILLYDPTSGDAQILVLKKNLSLSKQLDYTDWSTDQVLYVGHFGLPTVSIMLYDPQEEQSTFLAFDSSLNVVQQENVQSWGQASQILIGSFLDRASCLREHTCATGDDILVLNRSTGMIQQYIFSFSNQFKVYDNRDQGFLRDGIATTSTISVLPVNTSMFSLFSSTESAIHNEELY